MTHVTDSATAVDHPAPGRGPNRRRVLVAVIVVGLAGAGLGVGYLSARRSDPGAALSDPGAVHVHGLGVDPADGRLYVASHTGLFRIEPSGAATRVADRYQDTMGFTVAGPSRFLASGHPDMADRRMQRPGRPPLLGLIESTDAGRTWRSLSLLGQADLHSLAVSDRTVLAYDSTGERVLASTDRRTWETRSSLSLLDLTADPARADRVVAVGADGAVLDSADGGRTWAPAGAPPLRLVRWSAGGLWGVTGDGGVYRRDAAGAWAQRGRLEGTVEALAADGRSLYAAVDGRGVYRSGDGGRTWRVVYRPGRTDG